MTIVVSKVRTLNYDGVQILDAIFLPPKLVIFEKEKIFIVDVESHVDNLQQTVTYQLDNEVISKIVHDQILWLILKGGDIVVIDILCTEKLIKIISERKCRFHVINKVFETLYITSESGDCFNLPFSSHELKKKIDEGQTEVIVAFQKITPPKHFQMGCDISGLFVKLSSEFLKLTCPLTGLQDAIKTTNDLKHFVPWGSNCTAVMSCDSIMWIIDFIDSKIIHKFESEGTIYPLLFYKGILYYLTWDKSEIQVWRAWDTDICQLKETDNKVFDDNVTSNHTSQEILKLELNNLLKNLSDEDPMQVMPGLMSLYSKIDDCYFLLKVTTLLCEKNILYKSLLYFLQKRVTISEDDLLMCSLNEILIKCELIEYVKFRVNNDYENVKFLDQNFKELIIIFLTNSDLELASICWLKYSQTDFKISNEDVTDILKSVPLNIKMSTLIMWLKNIAPSLAKLNPYYVDLFVRWTMERVFLMEKSLYWPKIGLKFVQEVTNILQMSLTYIPLRPISMDDLDKLKDHLHYISELQDKYKINMLLGELSSQSPSEVALIMLRRCYTEDIESFLQNYLPQYSTRHSFDIDDTLRTFVESESRSSGGVVNSSRILIVLNAFRSVSSRLECLLQVLKVLDVPWDETMLNVATKAAASVTKDYTVSDSDLALAQEIKNELNYAKLKVILKKYNFNFSCMDFKLLLHKVINAANVDLHDLKTVISVLPAYATYGHILYIVRCLQDCEIVKAIDYFQCLLSREKKIVFKGILTKYEQIIKGDISCKTVEKNYLDFMKGTQMLNGDTNKVLENMYHLKNSYNIKLNMNDIYHENYDNDKISIQDTENPASSGRGRFLIQLTGKYDSAQLEVVNLLRNLSIKSSVRRNVEAILISQRDDSSENSSTVLKSFLDGNNQDILLETLNAIIELTMVCSEELLHFLNKCLSIFNSLVKTNIVIKNLSSTWKFHYIYLPVPTVTSLNGLIEFYLNPSIEFLLKQYLPLSNWCDIAPFSIFSALLSKIFPTDSHNKYTLINGIRKMLSKLITFQEIDYIMMTCLLIILTYVKEDESAEYILQPLWGQQEMIPPKVSEYLSNPIVRTIINFEKVLKGNSANRQPHYVLKTNYNLDLADFVVSDITEETLEVKLILFHVLKMYPDTTLEQLTDFCRSLNISLNYGLSLQLIAVLTTWDLEYRVVEDDLNCCKIFYENTGQKLLSDCLVIWESINNKDFIQDTLNDFWKNGEINLYGQVVSVNSYYYEVYLCIYHLIFGSSSESRNMKEYFLLNFLKSYVRKSIPKQYEFELFSVNGTFPKIGYYRLPFLLFMRDDMWTNLKSEITLETYERWLPAVTMLSLDEDVQTAKDMICSNALKQTMTNRRRKENDNNDIKENEQWRLTTKEEPLLRAAHKCVKYIANMEWAGACLFYVLQGCAQGADQVAAAQLCYQFAQRWTSIQPGHRAVRQMERYYSTVSTRHALHKIEWACEDFIRLLSEPSQLIRTLYLHPNFIHKITRHDINRAANEIAEKNNINISSIRIQILENILDKSMEQIKNKSLPCLEIEELITAKYILKATCPKMGAIYLSRIVFDAESDFKKCKKLRALQCLMSIADVDTIIKVTNRERYTLWESLLELFYTVNLETIDMPWVMATFTKDKHKALEQLLEAVGGNILGLKIASELVSRYGNKNIILNILPLLLRANLYDQIIPLLLKITSSPNEMVYDAWRTVLLDPFRRADYPITERQRNKCMFVLNLLPVCPVVRDEDLTEIWKHCIRCKCFGMGALLLPYMSPEARESLPEIKRIDKRNLIANLKNLHTETYLVSSAMHAIECIQFKPYR